MPASNMTHMTVASGIGEQGAYERASGRATKMPSTGLSMSEGTIGPFLCNTCTRSKFRWPRRFFLNLWFLAGGVSHPRGHDRSLQSAWHRTAANSAVVKLGNTRRALAWNVQPKSQVRVPLLCSAQLKASVDYCNQRTRPGFSSTRPTLFGASTLWSAVQEELASVGQFSFLFVCVQVLPERPAVCVHHSACQSTSGMACG